MGEILSKLRSDPVGLLVRGVDKILIGPRKYGRGDGYDASSYWTDRFTRYGTSIKGAGDEGLSVEENRAAYAEAARTVTEVLADTGVRLEDARVLEIGCGTGFYTELLRGLGVRSYVAQDVTDVLFAEHRARFPGFEFVLQDVTEGRIEGEFDLVLMIDVLEHIVEDDRLTAALANATGALAPGGVFVLGPVADTSRRHRYYVRLWSLEEVAGRLPEHELGDHRPFRTGTIVTIRRAHGG